MSTDADLTLAVAMFAAVAAGNVDTLDTLLSDDYTLHDAIMADQSSRAGCIEQLGQIRDRYVASEFAIHDSFGAGDRVGH